MRTLLRLLVASFVLSLATPSHASWGPGGSTILATNSYLGPMAACSDGGFGTFVVWQESASAGATGSLRALHVLPTGDPDPAWPAAGALVSDVTTQRSMVGALPDREGGFYVWWKEGSAAFVTRMLDAAVAPGWSARGRSIGTLHDASPRPSVIEDGAHGFYAAWIPNYESARPVVGIHLGPTNTGAGGWPNFVTALVSNGNTALWPELALAPDGGVFLGWVSVSANELVEPSAFRLQRFASDGAIASGWPDGGIPVAGYDPSIIGEEPFTSGLVDIAPDGRGGVFMLAASPLELVSPGPSTVVTANSRLLRLQGDGQPAAGWPSGGATLHLQSPWVSGGPDGSAHVLSDDQDGAFAAGQAIFTDSPVMLNYRRFLPDGQRPLWSFLVVLKGHEFADAPDGRFYLASFEPTGPSHPFDSNAFINVTGVPIGGSFQESHSEGVLTWYGDIALAETGDGGAVFLWSQVRERFGLFARRVTPGGEVTGVGNAAGVAGFERLSFARGQGVRARVAALAGARLDLFDLAGRRLATQRFDQAGPVEVTLPGTASLAPGLYFARFAGPGVMQNGRVVVAH